MNPAIKLSIACSGIFLLLGMIAGVIKYRQIMTSPENRASVYISIAHTASFLYSFAALVMAELLRYSPYSLVAQMWMAGIPLVCFALAIGQYFRLGLWNTNDNQFKERNFNTTWGMYFIIVGEIGGIALILWGFFQTQIFCGS
jgi:uncharacterized membrane protein YpjA